MCQVDVSLRIRLQCIRELDASKDTMVRAFFDGKQENMCEKNGWTCEIVIDAKALMLPVLSMMRLEKQSHRIKSDVRDEADSSDDWYCPSRRSRDRSIKYQRYVLNKKMGKYHRKIQTCFSDKVMRWVDSHQTSMAEYWLCYMVG